MKINTAKYKDLRKEFHEGDQIVSERSYNTIIGAVIFWGFLVNALIVSLFSETFLNINQAALIIGYFALAIAGVFVNKGSKNPVVSFIGYNMLVAPIGAVLCVVLAQYKNVSIINAIVVTGIVTGIMMTLSMIYPKVFLSMGVVLFIALLAAIVIEFICIIMFGTDPSIIDWIVAIIFCGYIGYDWASAQAYVKTIDNAVDSAFDIYLDIINLFLRILSIIGIKTGND